MTAQAYIDGLPIFTEGAFGWKPAYCGIMLGVLGLTAPLVNFSVGGLASRGLPDRIITVRPRAAAARRAGAAAAPPPPALPAQPAPSVPAMYAAALVRTRARSGRAARRRHAGACGVAWRRGRAGTHQRRVAAQVGSIVATCLGALALTRGPFPRANFFVAGVAVYMGTIVLEAVSMSLCSKARPAPAPPLPHARLQSSGACARAPAHVAPTPSLAGAACRACRGRRPCRRPLVLQGARGGGLCGATRGRRRAGRRGARRAQSSGPA